MVIVDERDFGSISVDLAVRQTTLLSVRMSIIVVLSSSMSSDQIQVVNQRRLETLLMGFRFEYEEIDASEPENKEIREMLFGLSNQRGKYPQIFIKSEDGSYEFAGTYDEVS
jgi:indole-3-glycerol phosphate synthase